MRKLLSVLLVFVLTGSALAGCTTSDLRADDVRIGLVTDVGGRGDQSLNDSALRGLEIWAAGKSYTQDDGYVAATDAVYWESLGTYAADIATSAIKAFDHIVPMVLESKDPADYVPNLTRLAEEAGCRLVISAGLLLADATYEVAKTHPDCRFMLVDAVPIDPGTLSPLPQLPNLAYYVFREEQAGFLAGAVAGYATRNNRVGFLGGMPTDVVQRYEAGFLAGIKTTNPLAYGIDGNNVPVLYAETFSDDRRGKQIAQTLLAQTCDVLFQAAGATGNGMFAALEEAGGPANGLWGIGVDTDMGCNSNLYPAGTLTSAVKHIDLAVYDAVRSVVDNSFRGTTVIMSVANDGVGYAPDHVADALSDEQIAGVERLRAMIRNGTLVPPADPDAVPAWIAPTSY